MMPSDCRFSLIVTCCNTEKYIGECLESLRTQDYDPAFFEVLCVDDGSTDHSPHIIRGFVEALSNFKGLRIENSGLEKACNLGIRQAACNSIIRVDADDMLAPHFLACMNDAMRQNPGFDFYYAKNYVEYYSGAHQIAKELPAFDPEEIFARGDFFATGTVYQKSDLAEVGYFPEKIKNCGLENYTVVLALLARQKKGLAVRGASFYYRRHPLNMSTVKRDAVMDYGKALLKSYGRSFSTNEHHPYGLKLKAQG